MKCVKCKKEIDEGDLFCGYCGVNQAKFIKYINKMGDKIRKNRDKEYNKNVYEAQNKLKKLENLKQKEINRIILSRWQNYGNDNFTYNLVEGKVNINGTEHFFSDIKSAEIKKQDSYRIITTEMGKSKKHVSLGKAIVGGALLGPIGAIAGGAMGKTTNTGTSTSNSIPTCCHIGVNVNLNGFTSEIILLSKTVDQSSSIYVTNLTIAQRIVDKLGELSQKPVPKVFLKPEEEKSVLDYDHQIEIANEELQEIIKNKPAYEISENYYN
jgi:hypothetical protein